VTGVYTTVRHHALDSITGGAITGYIYESEDGSVFYGARSAEETGMDWYPARDKEDATQGVMEMLNEVAELTFASVSTPQPPPPPTDQQYPQQGYQQAQQYPQQHYQTPQQHPQQAYQQAQQYPQQAYQTPQPYPQHQQPYPYHLTQADQRKVARKARNKAIRDAVWEGLKDSRDRSRLEKACLKYPCPECSSGRGTKCVSIHGRNTLPAPHVSRIEQYQRMG